MRESLEDAVIYYRREAEVLLLIASPGLVLGPILVIVASSGLAVGLATIPALVLVYIVTYAACVRAAGLVLTHQDADPIRVYLSVLRRAPDIAQASAPVGLLLATVLGAAFFMSDEGLPYLALAIGLLGLAATIHWALRHMYEHELILGHELRAKDARKTALYLVEGRTSRGVVLLAAVGLPLLAAALLTWGLAAAGEPVFGRVVFTSAIGVWLPFLAITLAGSCQRLMDEAAESQGVPGEAESPQSTIRDPHQRESSRQPFLMRLRFLRRLKPAPRKATGLEVLKTDGPEVIRDGTLLARWYIVHRLDEELNKARRYGRPLSIAVARPKLLPGERLSPEAVTAATEAARVMSRSTDLFGWLGPQSFLIIMPETDDANAKVALSRWRDDILMRSRSHGGQNWDILAMDNCQAETADELLRAVADSSDGPAVESGEE